MFENDKQKLFKQKIAYFTSLNLTILKEKKNSKVDQ